MNYIQNLYTPFTSTSTIVSTETNQPEATPAKLKEAIFGGDAASVQAMISADSSLLSTSFADGMLPLHAAVRLKQTQIVEYLVSRGAAITTKDYQGMSALDYAAANHDIELVRVLMPSGVVGKIDAARKQVNDFQYAGSSIVDGYLNKIEWLKNKNETITLKEDTKPTAQDLTKAILAGRADLVDRILPNIKDCNACDSNGISPMLAAAAMKDSATLQKLAAQQGDLLKKNIDNVAPADLLFADADRHDPLRIQKTQLLLGLLSLGSIVAGSYLIPELAPEAAALWSGGLMLLNASADLALSYNAYLQLSPDTIWAKAAYWATALGTMPVLSLANQVPGFRVVWDLWRTTSVCQRAFDQLAVAYNNFSYDKIRSLNIIGTQLLTLGTTAYHVQDTFKTMVKYDMLRNEIDSYPEKMQVLKDKGTELTGRENELLWSENSLKSRQNNFDQKKINWAKLEGSEQASVCTKILSNEIQAAKYQTESFQRQTAEITSHPILPYLMGHKPKATLWSYSEEQLNYAKQNSYQSKDIDALFKEAFCLTYGDRAEKGMTYNKITAAEFKKRYHSIGLLYQPDKCFEGYKDFCNRVFLDYRKAYEILNYVVKGRENMKVTCEKNAVIITTAKPPECPTFTDMLRKTFW